MTKQVFSIVNKDEYIEVFKNDILVYQISVKDKSISLTNLYNAMEVDINDEYFFANGLKKYEQPQNDSERIFNNAYDFLYHLLASLKSKLKELREKQNMEKCM